MSPQTANHMRLDGKVAVITGGAQGVGLGIAQEFVEYGATVIVADINEETLKRAGAALGPTVTTVVVDVTDLDQMQVMYSDIIARHGRLDAVVANVGAGDSNGVQSITEKQFDFVFGVNVKGVLFTVQPAIGLMRDGGTVVIIGSTASIQPPTGMSLTAGPKLRSAPWCERGSRRSREPASASTCSAPAPSTRHRCVRPWLTPPAPVKSMRSSPRWAKATRSAGSRSPANSALRPCSSPAKPRASSPVSNCSPTAAWRRPADKH